MARIGTVLSGSTTRRIVFEVFDEFYNAVHEGMLVLAGDCSRGLLARIDIIRRESLFYRVGDVWHEARRSGIDLPRDIGSYAYAEASVVGGIGGNYTPTPGDPVVSLDECKLESIYGVSRGHPGVIWYGSLLGYDGIPLALDVEALTMHLGVFGETGSGKSYGFGYLIELLSEVETGNGKAALPLIVVDANGDYIDYWYRRRLGCYERITRFVLPVSPLKYSVDVTTLTIDLNLFTARELAELVISYKTGGELPEMQVASLERVLMEAMAEGYTATELFTKAYRRLINLLEDLSSGKGAPIHHQTAKAIKSALEKFRHDVVLSYKLVSTSPSLSRDFIDMMVKEPSFAIIDFSAEGSPGATLPLKQLIVAYLLRLLYNTFTSYKTSGREAYLLLAIEEAQNYAPNPRVYPVGSSVARDLLALIATQGRKFGICLTVISQRPAFVDPIVVSMLNTMILHRLSPDDVAFVSKLLGGLPSELERMLVSLPRGYALVVGQANMLRAPVIVKVGKRRVEHRMGSTRMLEYLRSVSKS